MAFFVEGQSEEIFVEQLLYTFFGRSNVSVRIFVLGGHNHGPGPPDGMEATARHYALIYNCGNDERALSLAKERFGQLANAGFCLVAAVRDLYPSPLNKLAGQRALMESQIANMSILGCTINLVLFVHEFEALYFCEQGYFKRLFPGLDDQFTANLLGNDWQDESVERIHHPSAKVAQIYSANNAQYDKSRNVVEAAVGKLDWESLVFGSNVRRPSAIVDLVELLEGAWVGSWRDKVEAQ